MAAVSIRDLDDGVRERLRIRAAANGRSMEAEMRAILEAAVAPARGSGLLTAVRDLMLTAGGVDLELPPRITKPRAPDFDG